MKFGKYLALGALLLLALSGVACRHVYRMPRVIVETVRTPNCYGKLYTYPCRAPGGNLKKEIIRCRRWGRYVTKRRKWVQPDPRCRRGGPVDDPTPPPADDAP